MSHNDFFAKEHVLENDRARLEPLTEAHYMHLLPIALNRELWEFTSVSIKTEEVGSPGTELEFAL